jgi:excisionase family DNA binding protein
MHDERILLTIPQFAEAVGVSRQSAYGLIKSGAVPAIKLGGRLRIPRLALDELIRSQLDAQRKTRATTVGDAA